MGYAPHHRLSGGASPQGEAAKRLTIFSGHREAAKRLSLLLEQKNRTRYAPHQSTTLTASPRGEALKRRSLLLEQKIEQGTPLISQLR